jgi:hypothetical protein
MRTGRQWVAGLFAASLLLSVPASALHQASAVASMRQPRLSIRQQGTRATAVVSTRQQRLSIQQAGTSATAVILHQNGERRTAVAFSRALRAQFRRAGPFLRASVNRYLRDLLLDLRAHWRAERRTGVVSPFDFPDL